jgi:DNA-directed RNA polymerase subunit RPC12/RpoP
MKEKIACPNCGKAYLIKKKLQPGELEENGKTEIAYECPECKILFHEKQLGVKLN